MSFISMDHMKVTHNYTGDKWQDFTGDLAAVSIVLRELSGTHTAAMSFYRANMDPSQSDGTHVVKKGDLVNVWVGNVVGRRRKLAQFFIKSVKVEIDLTKRAGRTNKVTCNMQSVGVGGVAGTGSA